MTDLRSKNDNTLGFVDPYVVFKEPNPSVTWINDMCTNLMRFFMNQKDKKRILFPYNFK
jgi:hypothetical protein